MNMATSKERTFIMLKPDAVSRKLVGEIITRIEKKGFNIVAMKMMTVDRALAERHYAVHREKPFFQDLVNFIIESPVVVLVLEGHDVVKQMRNLIGSTSPAEAQPGTIRGDFATDVTRNLIHASDSESVALQEIANFFSEKEIMQSQ